MISRHQRYHLLNDICPQLNPTDTISSKLLQDMRSLLQMGDLEGSAGIPFTVPLPLSILLTLALIEHSLLQHLEEGPVFITGTSLQDSP